MKKMHNIITDWDYGLAKKYGNSAATTYCWLRINGQPAKFALMVMRSQIAHLGLGCSGGFDCVPYRKARII